MTNNNRLDEIESNFDSMGSVDKDWLISRVKTLTTALERIKQSKANAVDKVSLLVLLDAIQLEAYKALTDGES